MTTDAPKLLILETGLFSDRETVRQALSEALKPGEAETIALKPSTMQEEDWDRVVDRILKTGKIVTI